MFIVILHSLSLSLSIHTHTHTRARVRKADPSGRALYGVGLRPLAFWGYGFESCREHGGLSLVNVVCCLRQKSVRRADHSSGGVLLSAVCLWSWCLSNEKVLAHYGPLSHKKDKYVTQQDTRLSVPLCYCVFRIRDTERVPNCMRRTYNYPVYEMMMMMIIIIIIIIIWNLGVHNFTDTNMTSYWTMYT